MTLNADDHIQQLLDEISKISNDYHTTWGKHDMFKRLKTDYETLISKPVSIRSKEYRSFTNHLQSLRKKLADSLHHLDIVSVNIQLRLNDPDSRTKSGKGEIHALPPEVLSEIFKLGHDGSGDTDKFAFNISQVCNKFRDVALQTPILWSCLWPENSWYHTSLFIERSSPVGLIVNIQNRERLKKFMAITTQHCKRWYKVIINFKEEIEPKYMGSDPDFYNDFEPMDEYEECLNFVPKDLALPRLTELEFDLPLVIPKKDLPFATWSMPKLKRFEGSTLHTPALFGNITDCSLHLRFPDTVEMERIGIPQLIETFKNLGNCESHRVVDRRNKS